MRLRRIDIKNFRCFTKQTFDVDGHIVVVQGANGTGKSSFLEALHYLCYLRSFRASSPRDLVRFDQESFFLKTEFTFEDQDVPQQLQVGFSQKKRLVKLNKKNITSFKELMDYYRVVTITEDNLNLITGGPEIRRRFIDQAIMLENQEYPLQIREYRKILVHRNSLLANRNRSREQVSFWTEQLWSKSKLIEKLRKKLLVGLQTGVNRMLNEIFDEPIDISVEYKPKKREISKELLDLEYRYGRSLFGAHLDDILISFQNKKSKSFASRGQQKLTVLLFKVAQLERLEVQRGQAVLLLDDFMTDFDDKKITVLVEFLGSLKNQLLFTSPSRKTSFDQAIAQFNVKYLKLTI